MPQRTEEEIDRPGASTLAMVAARAGVSKGTASKALNNHYGVSPATRTRVMQAAAELEFAPNAVARSLFTGRSETIGMLTNDLGGRFALPIMHGAELALSAEDGTTILLSSARGSDRVETLRVRALLSRRVDGLLVVGDRSDPRQPLAETVNVPIVYVYSPSSVPSDVSVTPDDAHGGYLAAQHLLERGARHIAMIAGDDDFTAAHQRLVGAQRALTGAGLSLEGPTLWTHGWDEHVGAHAAAQILDSGMRVEGLICGSDSIARGAMHVLSSRGVAIPQDIRVVGFDNMDTVAPWTHPALTTIDLNLQAIGRRAVEMLVALQTGSAEVASALVPSTLIVRAST